MEVKTETPQVEVLSARIGSHPSRWAGCSKERWMEVMAPYPQRARNHAANLAAHSYDVLLIDGQIALIQPSQYRSDKLPENGHWLFDPIDRSQYKPLPKKLVTALYECRGRYAGHERRFDATEQDQFQPVRF